LAIVLVRAGAGAANYGINIFSDGRVAWQSLRCPVDRTMHMSKISNTDMARLTSAFAHEEFFKRADCEDIVTDTPVVVLGFDDGTSKKIAFKSMGYVDPRHDLIAALEESFRWLK